MKKIFKLLLPLMVFSITVSSDFTPEQTEKLDENRVVNRQIVDRYGEIVNEIEPSETIEEEAIEFMSDYVYKNEDGTFAIDLSFEEEKDKLAFICDEEDQIQFDSYVDFVIDNMTLANDLIENGFGSFDEDGNFIPNIEITDEYEQQEISITNFSYSILKGWKFTMSDTLTSIAGWAGVLVSVVNILGMFKNFANMKNQAKPKDLKSLVETLFKNSDKKTKDEILKALAKFTPSAAKFGTKVASNTYPDNTLIAAVWGGITIACAFLGSNPYGWIATIILTVLSLYLPSAIRGIVMGIQGFQGHKSKVNIGYWWSTYDVI